MRALCPALAVLTLLAACSSHRDEPATLQPPPDTGAVVTDMDGWWAVTEIVRLDSDAPLPFADPTALPFLSVQPGQVVAIADGSAYDLYGERLYETFAPGVPNRRYHNAADDRFWLFEVDLFREQDCLVSLQMRCAFGTFDADTLDGFVEVGFFTSCAQPAIIRPNPNGRYFVRMVRVMPLQIGR